MLSMIELAKHTNTNTSQLLRLARTGKIIGSKTPGRTGSWQFDDSVIEQVNDMKGTELPIKREKLPNRPRPIPESPLGPEWINTAEAASMIGVTMDAIHKRIKAGKLDSQLVNGRLWLPLESIKQAAKDYQEVRAQKPKYQGLDQPTGGKNYKVSEVADLLGVTPSVIHYRISIGAVKAQSVQTAPGQHKLYLTAAEVEKLKGMGVGPHLLRHNLVSKPKPPQPTATISREPETDLLTRNLLALADLIRTNPMMRVTKLDVDITFKG